MIKRLAIACSVALLYGCSTPSNERVTRIPDDTYRPSGFHAFINHGTGNIPVGLIKADSLYHLYYTTGSDEWGHLSSSDLLEWKPQASLPLQADGNGTVIWDSQNTSGLNAPWNMLLVRDDELYLSYSSDGNDWVEYEGNPVVNTDGKPAVFWSDDLEQWILTLAQGSNVSIFTSYDLKDWQEGSVQQLENDVAAAQLLSHNGRWFMLLQNESVSYQLGTFDGTRFEATSDLIPANGLDVGLGSIVYENGQPILISRSNTSDPQLPTFSSPLALEISEDGLKMKPSPTFHKQIISKRRAKLSRLKTDGPSWYQFRIEQDFNRMEIVLSDNASELNITWDANKQEVQINGSALVGGLINHPFQSANTSDNIVVDVLIDHATVDVFINDGEYTTNIMTQPAPFFTQVQVKLDGEEYDARGILYDIGG